MAELYFKVKADYEQVVRLREEIAKLETQMKSFASAGDLNKAMENSVEIQKLTAQMKSLTEEAAKAGAALQNQLKQGIEQANNAISGGDGINGVLDLMLNKLKGVGTMLAGGMTVGAFVNQVTNVRSQFQQLEVSFNTMLGNAEKAEELMAQLTKTAAITPFDLQGVAQGAKQLLAYGIQADEVNETLTRLGDIAAGLSLPLGDLVYLYGTTMTQGRMYTQDLRQFMGRGIPLAEELAKQFGVTKDEVGDLVKKGKIGAEEFKKAIWSMSNEGGKFGGLMEEQSKTIGGQISNIQDAIDTMFNEIGQKAEPIINGALGAVSWAVDNYKTLAEAIGAAVVAYGSYKAIMMVVVALENRRKAVLAAMRVAMKAAAADGVVMTAATARDTAVQELNTAAKQRALLAVKNLYAATLANPYAWAAVGVAALAAGIYSYSTNADAATKAQEGFNKSLEETAKAAEERKQKITELVQKIKSADNTDWTKQLAYDELKALAPAITDVYDSMQKLAKADLSDVNKQIDKMGNEKDLEGIKNKIDAITSALNKLDNPSTSFAGNNGQGRYKGVIQSLKTALPDVDWSFWDSDAKVIEIARKSLADYTAQYQKLINARNEANKTTDQKITDTKASLTSVKEQADIVSKALLAMEGDAMAANSKVANDAGKHVTLQTDNMYDYLTKKVADMKKYMSEHPMEVNVQTREALERYQRLLSAMATFKKTAQSNGTFTIPIIIKAMVTTIENTLKSTQAQIAALEEQKKAEEAEKKEQEDEKAKKAAEAARRKAQAAAEKAKREQERREQAAQRAEEMVAEQNLKNTDADIDLDENAHRKQLSQIENNYQKQLQTIEKWKERIKKENKTAGTSTLATGLTQEQTKTAEKATSNALKARDKQIKQAEKEWKKEQEQAIIEYLSQYGNMEARRLAITRDYEMKIAEEKDEVNKATLRHQMADDLKALDEEVRKSSVSWERLFGDVSNLATEQLRDIQDELRNMLSADNLGVDEFSQIVAQIEKINDAIADNAEERNNFLFGWGVNSVAAQRNRLTRERDSARNISTSANRDLEMARRRQQNAQNAFNLSGKKEGSAQWQTLQDANKKLETAERNAAQAAQNLTDKQNKLTNFSDKLANKFKEIQEWADSINTNIQAMPEMMEALGLGDTAVAEKVGQFADMANNAVGAYSDFMSGNYVGAAAKAISAIGSFGEAFGIWGESDKHYAEDMEKLTIANNILKDSIDKLAEKMEHSSLIDALNIYQQQMDNLEQAQSNMQEQLARSGASYKSGMGGDHSTNYRIDRGMTKNDWQAISKAVGKSITQASDLWALSSEEMATISTDAITQWTKLMQLADDGHQDLTSYLEEYITLYELAEQATDNMKQTTTQTTFDGVVSSFKSAIMDMNHTASDFANDFEDMMKNAVLSAMVEETYSSELETWYNDFYEAMKGNSLTKEEQEALRKRYIDMANAAKSQRDALYETLGWSDTTSQTASSKGFSAMSQDTASELNGRFTAMQIAMERVAVNSDSALTRLAEMAVGSQGYYPNIIAIGDNILRQQAESYIELQQINARQETWDKPMRKAFDNIEKMRTKIDTL